MNLSPKLRYFLSYLGLSLLLIIALYFLAVLYASTRGFGHKLAFLMLLAVAAFVICWRHFILIARLGFPSHEFLKKLENECEKTKGFTTPSDDPLLKPYLEVLTQGKSPQDMEYYKKSLSFCTTMASPHLQKAFHYTLLAAVLCLGIGLGLDPEVLPPLAVALFGFGLACCSSEGMSIPWSFAIKGHPPILEVREDRKPPLISLDALLLLAGFIALGVIAFTRGLNYSLLLGMMLILPFFLIIPALWIWYANVQSKIGRLPYASLVKLIAYSNRMRTANRQNEEAVAEDPEIVALWHQHQEALTRHKGELSYCAFFASPDLRKGLYNNMLAVLLLFPLKSSGYVDSSILEIAAATFILLGFFRFYRAFRNIFGVGSINILWPMG